MGKKPSKLSPIKIIMIQSKPSQINRKMIPNKPSPIKTAMIHGIGHFFPKTEFMLRSGKATVKIFNRITPTDTTFRNGKECRETAKLIRQFYEAEYKKLAHEIETADYYKDLVLHNYIYKSRQIEQSARKVLKEKEEKVPSRQ